MPLVDPRAAVSPHFTWGELTVTRNAALQAANRDVPEAHQRALVALATTILEPIRQHVGRPVVVTSGYRCAALNAATDGASPTSQHMRGEAADIIVPGMDIRAVWEWVWKHSGLAVGQAIWEHPPGRTPWLHVSLGAPWRDPVRCGQVMTYDGKAYVTVARVAR